MFEYKTFSSVVKIEPNEFALSSNQIQENITLQMDDTLNRFQIEKRSHGDFEILSHSLLLFGDRLIISFLLRRDIP
jgi:hypothetical protein